MQSAIYEKSAKQPEGIKYRESDERPNKKLWAMSFLNMWENCILKNYFIGKERRKILLQFFKIYL